MAICVANDVGEGAFDLLPHSVLLKKTMDVIPDNLWRLLYYWYKHMEVVM